MDATEQEVASGEVPGARADAAPGVVQPVPDDGTLGRSQMEGSVDPQLVSGLGKTPQQIAASLLERSEHQRVVLATRIEPAVYAAVRKLVPGVEYHGGAKILTLRVPKELPRNELHRLPGSVAIVTCGTADLTVAEECRLVAEHMGCYVYKITELEVQDFQKLLSNAEAIQAASVVVVVAGTDAALPSVVAGLVEVPVVVVPTSAGHATTMGGVVTLLANLNSACPGMSVVNVDNGIGAAMAAARMLKTADKIIAQKSQQALMAATTGNKGHFEQNGNGHKPAAGDVVQGNGSGAAMNSGVNDGMDGKMGGRIGKPLLGLLIFQTVPLLPKLVPLGIGASVTLT
ncbi:unnamed protein product [Ostreobium quekettii]|uniref:phosphoribosylaminoimidazole carboxylase n=1 Tax=Ostreobium quekettii TaxID=121088 RepID=A0A8S1JDJ4_9CHLO|nr:unnamed protein product [Ostreobium quekettii]